MNPADFIIRYRTQIFITLIFFEITFSIGAYSYRLTATKLFFIAETFTTLAIIILSFILLDKFNLFSYLANQRKTVLNSAPSHYIVYDLESGEVNASLAAVNLLNLNKKKTYELSDIASLYDNEQWRDIEKIIQEPGSYINIEKTGELGIIDKENFPTFIKYKIQVIRERELGIYVVLFWFFDFTETKMIQEEFQNYLSKYREIAFSQDLLLSQLTTPICLFNEKKDMAIYNDMFVKMLGLDMGSKGLKKQVIQNCHKLKNHTIYKSNALKQYFEISRSSLDHNLGEVIIASDNSLEHSLKKEIESFSNAFEEISQLSNCAIMIIDGEGSIVNFNKKILEIFDLDEKWLKEHPNFSEFLDKLKQKNQIPESVDYISYKSEMLKYLMDDSTPHIDFMHRSEGSTLKVSLLPCKGKGKIYVCEDISDVLTMERSYNQIKQVLNEVISTFDIPVIVIGYDGIIKQFNECIFTFFKIEDHDSIANRHYSEFIGKISNQTDNIQSLTTTLTSCLESRQNKNLTLPLPNNDNLDVKIISLPDNSIMVSFKTG